MSTNTPTQSDLLWKRLDAIGRRAWRFALVIGVSKFLLAVGLVAFAACLLDVFLRLPDAGTRIIVTGLCMLAAIVGYMRWVAPAIRARLSTSQVARYVERAVQLPDGWLSSVAELRERSSAADSSAAGFGESTELRQLAIQQAESLFSVSPLESAVDSRQATRWLSGLGVAALLLAAVSVSFPQSSIIALQRLIQPWADVAWPRSCQLEFLGLPSMLARGSELEITAINRIGKLPDDVRLQVRPSSDGEVQEFEMQRLQEQAFYRMPLVDESFEVRVTSSLDDSMKWHAIQVAKPPSMTDYQFEVTPPEYTQVAPSKVTGHSLRLLAGTMIRLQGSFDQPIERLAIDDIQWPPQMIPSADAAAESPPTYASEADAPAVDATMNGSRPKALEADWQTKVLDDKRTFVLEMNNGQPITIAQNVRFHLRWESSDGLIARSDLPFDIEIIPDLPPEVVWTESANAASVSSVAKIALAIQARDDLRIEQVMLHWESTKQDGSPKANGQATLAELATGSDASLPEIPSREVPFDTLWSIPESEPSDAVTVWFAAIDSAGQTGLSPKRTYTISDPKELLAEMANSQFDVSQAVRQSIMRQRQSKAALSKFLDVAKATSQIDAQAREDLAAAASQQEAANRWLTDQNEGAIRRLKDLSERMQQNGLRDTQLAKEVQQTLEDLDSLAKNETSDALNTLRNAQGLPNEQLTGEKSEALASALDKQNRAEQKLSEVLDRLGQQATFREYVQQVRAIAQQQQTILSDTEELASRILEGESPTQLANRRARIQSAQREAARRVDQFIADARRDIESMDASDPNATKDLQDLTDRLVESAIAQKMRQAADALNANAQTQASEQIQSEIVRELTSALGSSEATASDPTQMAEQLAEISAALGNLADQQTELAQGLQAGEVPAAEAAQRQSAINQQTQQQLQALSRAGEADAAEPLNEARELQEQAQEELNQGDMSSAAESAAMAAEQMRRSVAEIDAASKAAQQESQTNELMQLQAAVDRILPQQNKIVDQIQSVPTDGSDQLQAKRAIATQQDLLRGNLDSAKPDSPTSAAFTFATQLAVDAMRRAAIAVERESDNATSLRHAKAAAERLAAIQTALRDEAKPPDQKADEQQKNDETNADEAQEEQAESTPVMKAVILLRSIQSGIRQRVAEIQTQAGDKLSPQQWLEVNELANEQQMLADQVQQLLEQGQ